MRLTDLAIQKLPPPPKGQKTYFDDLLHGFGVRVSQGGSKSFVVMYGEKRRLKTLGRYPSMTLKAARQEAMAFIASGNPDSSTATFSEALMAFLEHCDRTTSPRTKADYKRLLERYFPTGRLANRTRTQLLTKLSELAPTPGEQSHAATAFNVFLNWCVANGHIQGNPISGIRGIGRIKKRERLLTDDELKVILRKALNYPHPFGQIVALCVLTGQRRSEIASLEWGWIDAKTITLPAHITKNRREHTFPYHDFTKDVLATIPRTGPLLFPGRDKESVWNGWSKAKRMFDPLKQQWQIHDLRRFFASKHGQIGTPIHITERLLNHVSGQFAGVAGIYNRYDYLEPMAHHAKLYEQHLAALVSDRSGTNP